MLITSLSNNHIKDLVKLKEKKYRDETKTYLIEGEHLVIEAYKENVIKELILENNELFPLKVNNTIYVTKEIIKKLSSSVTPTSIMAVVQQKENNVIGEKILILDNIQDPGNLGTIIRSAVAFNFDTIVLSESTVDMYNPKVLRSTQGMIFHVNIIIRDLIPFIENLKQQDYKIVGTNVKYGVDVRDAKIYNHFALVLGNEGSGIRPEIEELCHEALYIKMNEEVESLNVGVAGSILMYEIANK